MPDYEFYRTRFGGSDLNAADFARYAAGGQRLLKSWQRRWQFLPAEPHADELAVCQLAETLAYFDWAENGGATGGISVGSVSCKGRSLPRLTPKTKAQELYRAAGLYFDIYRGPGGAPCA